MNRRAAIVGAVAVHAAPPLAAAALAVAAAAFLAACSDGGDVAPRPLEAPGGVSLGLFASDPDYDYRPMVDEIAARGAHDVLIVVPISQANAASPSPETDSVNHRALRDTLDAAARAGLRTAVMPIVTLEDRAGGAWRGELTPSGGAEAWLRSYASVATDLARTAEERGAVRFVVGSELNSMQTHREPWAALVRDVRAAFSGRLSYSANWDAYETVAFWDLVDEIGVSAYFPVHGEGDARRRAADAWRVHWAQLSSFGAAHGRPVVLTEIGFPAHGGAASTPWDETVDAPVDPTLQADLLRGFCDASAEHPSAAFYVWNWFGWGGPRDPGYTPRGKPAAAVLRSCFASA